MNEQRSALQRLAARLAREEAIDWDAEERAAHTDEDRATVREMRASPLPSSTSGRR